MRRMSLAFTLLLLLGLLGSRPAWATTWYAAPSGGGGCSTTPSNPIGGLGNGIRCLSGGDTLILKAGTYAERIDNGAIPSGSSGQPTVLRGETARTAILRPNGGSAIITIGNGSQGNITLDGLVLDGNWTTTGYAIQLYQDAYNIVITNNEITRMLGNNNASNSGGVFLYGAAGSGMVVRGNSFHDLGGETSSGLCSSCYTYGIYMPRSDALVENNEFVNISGYGVHGYSSAVNVSNNIIRNNFFRATGPAILVGYQSGGGNQIYNNIILYPGTSAYPYERMGLRVSGLGDSVFNNTIVGAGAECGWLQGARVTASNNICWLNASNTFSDMGNDFVSNTLTTNPLFVNATPQTAADVQLQAGSPARNGGTCTGAPPTDYGGGARPQEGVCDIGAWEYGAAVVAATYHVAQTGGLDSRSCQTATARATPVATIAKGLSCLGVAGSTLLIHAGTYLEAVDSGTQFLPSGTSWSTPTTITSYGQDVVTLRLPPTAPSGTPVVSLRASDQYIILAGLVLDANQVSNSDGLYAGPGTHHIRLQASEVLGTTDVGVFLDSANNVEVLTSRIHATTGGRGAGLWLRGTTSGALLQGLEVDHNTGPGVLLEGSVSQATLQASFVHDNGGLTSRCGVVAQGTALTGVLLATSILTGNYCGVQVASGTSGARLYHLTVVGQTTTGVQIDAGASTTTIRNSILASNGGAGLVDAGTGTSQAGTLLTGPVFVRAPAPPEAEGVRLVALPPPAWR